MKYIDEFREKERVLWLKDQLHKITTKKWTIMEVCGGQTHAIVRFGIDRLLPDNIELVHGPGCPVCVTPLEAIDKALEIAATPEVIFCSFGDMLRVPGSKTSLLSIKAQGADIRTVYSPVDAVKIAKMNPQKQVVFFAVGFETTAPANAMAVLQAKEEGVENFSLLVSHVLVPPAIETILSSENNRVQGFLAAGHVCTVMGLEEYKPLVEKYQVPIVATGFEPVDILEGILMVVSQLENNIAKVENQYLRSVKSTGNIPAQEAVKKVFTIIDRKWRGVGTIPTSGLGLSEEFMDFDAEERFETKTTKVQEPKECISGLVLQGLKKPSQCPAFGTLCTPENPLGATMVSSEGACAAYYHYRRNLK